MTESIEKKHQLNKVAVSESSCGCPLGLNKDQALKLEVCKMLIPHYRDVASLRRMTADIVQMIKE